MATQGLVTIKQNGKVTHKIVVGCDGYNADSLVDAIKNFEGMPSINDLARLSRVVGFGCDDCRVVLDSDSSVVGLGVEELNGRYRNTFEDERFNPRWEKGTVDYVRVIAL